MLARSISKAVCLPSSSTAHALTPVSSASPLHPAHRVHAVHGVVVTLGAWSGAFLAQQLSDARWESAFKPRRGLLLEMARPEGMPVVRHGLMEASGTFTRAPCSRLLRSWLCIGSMAVRWTLCCDCYACPGVLTADGLHRSLLPRQLQQQRPARGGQRPGHHLHNHHLSIWHAAGRQQPRVLRIWAGRGGCRR